jgi:hypothetical protein
MALNSLGIENAQQGPPATLPKFALADIDIEREAHETPALPNVAHFSRGSIELIIQSNLRGVDAVEAVV